MTRLIEAVEAYEDRLWTDNDGQLWDAASIRDEWSSEDVETEDADGSVIRADQRSITTETPVLDVEGRLYHDVNGYAAGGEPILSVISQEETEYARTHNIERVADVQREARA